MLDRAWNRMERDLKMVLKEGEDNTLWRIFIDGSMGLETYRIEAENGCVSVTGADELGVIYGLLFVSEEWLGIKPFWFWNDQAFERKGYAETGTGGYVSGTMKVRYRGWFINDEVLLEAWGKEIVREGTDRGREVITENFAWEMAMEALLRLGGNMVIPGTDFNSHKYRALAVDMGLWVTHHHAEPLGARMFARAFPQLTPSYAEHPDLFHQLWQEAIEEQMGHRTIWNLGFRGQGDRPFWADDASFDTPQKRGGLISSLIQKQYDMVAAMVENPVCCTNLYGEVMELYQQGHIHLPENVIYIWADNGYGKMVSRRQGSHNPRVTALPEGIQEGCNHKGNKHGMYYHASFYDLQAAAHITMLPNSVSFVTEELEHAFEAGVNEFMVVNCSNVKPHTYMLHAIASVWGKSLPAYAQSYFPCCHEEVEALYNRYFESMIAYGPHSDDHAGEQFYHYTMRALCHGWTLGRLDQTQKDLVWIAGNDSLAKQAARVQQMVEEGIGKLRSFYEDCGKMRLSMESGDNGSGCSRGERTLFGDSLGLQSVIHYLSACAEQKLCRALGYFISGLSEKAFCMAGAAIESLQGVLRAMKEAEHDKWAGFYENDCLVDVKFTIYSLEGVMRFIRACGDGPHYFMWARKYTYPGEDNKVILLTNTKNHPLDWELYLAMKKVVLTEEP